MRIDSSGQMGIGVSPATNLHISSASSTPTVRIESTHPSGIPFLDLKGASSSQIRYIDETGTIQTRMDFTDNGGVSFVDVAGSASARMTIDSSGNVLVGKTTSSLTTVGIELKADGNLLATRAGAVASLNREDSDGAIIDLRKDGTTVGLIGTSVGSTYIGGNSDGAIYFNGTSDVRPWNKSTQANLDNSIDLGTSSARFKDLYLGGGVYLGGTTSSNALDDYEEGTHQATITCGTSGTITLDATRDLLSYTKIGRLMTVTGELKVSAVSSPTGNFQISLPTAIASLNEEAGRSVGSITITNTSVNIDSFVARGFEGNSFVTVFKGGSSGGSDDSANTFSGNEFITLYFSYVSA
jgi:hypothetical protein